MITNVQKLSMILQSLIQTLINDEEHKKVYDIAIDLIGLILTFKLFVFHSNFYFGLGSVYIFGSRYFV